LACCDFSFPGPGSDEAPLTNLTAALRFAAWACPRHQTIIRRPSARPNRHWYLPHSSLPAFAPDPGLALVSYEYFRVDPNGLPLYPGLEAAISQGGAARYLEPGFVYLAYTDRVDTGQGIYYMLSSGEWFPGDGSRVSYSNFQGLEFSSTPRNAFGWVLSETPVKRAPGHSSADTGRSLYRLNLVQILLGKQVNGQMSKMRIEALVGVAIGFKAA
jgi:hypothetical protein